MEYRASWKRRWPCHKGKHTLETKMKIGQTTNTERYKDKKLGKLTKIKGFRGFPEEPYCY